jgi:ESCRT-I complex subunit TSG101
MVHDPRVTTLLSRLGGLYRDPSRVDRDASSLLRSSVGEHLSPGIAALVENDGNTCNCMVLQGTIAIVFRGNTYQLLVDIYLPPGYPVRQPIAYVRLAQNMYLKENHPHVASDGLVYLPYLHEWNGRTHSLIEMVVAMSSVFSADPPVFTRSAQSAPPPPRVERLAPPAYDRTTISAAERLDSERYMQQQIEAIMAKEAAEANAAAEAARRAEQEALARRRAEQEALERQLAAQQALESKQKEQIKEMVNQKILAHIHTAAADAVSMVQSDWMDQQLMKQSRERIDKELNASSLLVQQLEENISILDSKTVDIETWLEESKNSNEQSVAVDDLCRPASKLHAQLLDLSSENAAITDALYFLDRGMYMGHIDCTTHLKSVRELAKRQFMVRAHLLKINQALRRSARS